MFKEYFELIDGVELYPVFSLIVFLFFYYSHYPFFKTDKDYIEKMEKLPLEKN
ncbi:MAG: CcoQ/FixQ family Cbb3-type cytochrome c oxidase assembly chaperone [Ignavibacteria bacterium]|nr:CcoQ/FixQ family Cbb3-type cytochrome c oxidase assembly chaperone [Ignavibacteria bacterium]